MKMEDLEKELEEHDLEYCGQCHDCDTSVSVLISVTEKGAIEVKGGAIYKVKQGLEDRYFFKCEACFKNNRTLRHFHEIEVWSRVVGYLRPVKQWNKGKIEEYKQRVLFKNTEGK